MINRLILVSLLILNSSISCFGLRIIGGEKANIASFPSTVSLQQNGEHSCGGTIINNVTILTAAHCVKPFTAKVLAIRAGSDFHDQGGVVRKVSRVKMHPKYSDMTLNHDVALVFLSSPLEFSSTIKSVPIAVKGDLLPANANATVSGWGTTVQDGEISKHLRSAVVKVISIKKCRKLFGTQIKSTMFCAGLLSGSKDACQGDSGGGLIVNGKVAGVVSWGLGCGMPNLPGIYTRVATVSNWIMANMKN